MNVKTNLTYALAAAILALAVFGFAVPAFANGAAGQAIRVCWAETGDVFTGVISEWTDEGVIISFDGNE